MTDLSQYFMNYYHGLYATIREEYREETGEDLKEYKPYEPELLTLFYEKYEDENTLLDQQSKLLSQLILTQSLPNANHRTAFRFVALYSRLQGIKIETYFKAKEEYDEFYKISKYAVDNVSNAKIFDNSYIDVHHYMEMKTHLKSSKELLKKISPLQSGIIDAVPFHRFISSLYQDGIS